MKIDANNRLHGDRFTLLRSSKPAREPGVIFERGMNMKKLMLLIFVFLLLPFYLFATERPANEEVANAPKQNTEAQIQKDEKQGAPKRTNITTTSTNDVKKSNNKKPENIEISQAVPRDDNINSEQQNTNLRVAKATEWNAYATIAIAILTIILAFETIRLRLIQAKQIKSLSEEAIKPKIELFLETNKYAINFLEIHIVNNGNGTANNIKFFFEAEANEAIETSKSIISKIQIINFFKIGLRYLGAGQSKKSFLMSATENDLGGNENFFKSIINAKITCEDDLGKEYTYQYIFNMSEFQGIRSIGTEPSKEMADSLKKICDSFTNVVGNSSGNKRIQADIFDDSSREREDGTHPLIL